MASSQSFAHSLSLEASFCPWCDKKEPEFGSELTWVWRPDPPSIHTLTSLCLHGGIFTRRMARVHISEISLGEQRKCHACQVLSSGSGQSGLVNVCPLPVQFPVWPRNCSQLPQSPDAPHFFPSKRGLLSMANAVLARGLPGGQCGPPCGTQPSSAPLCAPPPC